MMSVDDMESLFQEKRRGALDVVLDMSCVVERRRHFDTTRGCVLTTQAALSLVEDKASEYHEKCAETACRAEEKEARARLAKITKDVIRTAGRPLTMRRQIGRERAKARKSALKADTTLAKLSEEVDEV